MFLLVVLTVVTGIHGYLWLRLVRDTTASRRGRRAGTAGIVLLALLIVAGLVGGRLLSPAVARPLAWVGYLGLALMFYLLVALAVLELPRFAVRRGSRSADPSRRLLLARVLAATAGVAAVGTVGYGVTQARRPRLKPITIRLERLDPAFDGYRIALLTDIHLGPILGRDFLADVVARVNQQRVDLVAVSGDLVDGDVETLGAAARPLAALRSRDGTFFVTGNHEYFSAVEGWLPYLASLGVRVLRNERVEIRRGTAAFDLAGVDDFTAAASGVPGHGANLGRALAGRDPNRAVVLLAHQPRVVSQAAALDVDLQLSGHTHGGQLAPFNLLVRLQQPVVAGLARVRRTWLYVSRGVGFWGPPVRVGAPPEITVITLRSRSTAS